MNKVAVVILNWNGKPMLEQYLAPLVKNTPTQIISKNTSENNIVSVIIADNNSTDGSIDWVKRNFPNIQTIILNENYGFTGGYNRALQQVEAEDFVLRNSDILVPDNWLQPLINFMDTHPDVGICQPKMLSLATHMQVMDKKEKLEEFEYAGAAGGFIDRWGFPFCRGRIISTIEKDSGQYDTPMQVFWASGACMVVKSSLWRELGGLDESFFAHMEEIDFCWRAQLNGYQVWAVAQSHVFHLGGGTLPNDSPRKMFFNYRNNLLMLYKNLPVDSGWEVFGFKKFNRNAFIFIRMCIDGLTAVAYTLQGKFSFAAAVYKAHNAFRRMKKEAAITQMDNNRPYKPVGIVPISIIIKKVLGITTFGKLLKQS